MATCACSVSTASVSPTALSLPAHHVILPKPSSPLQHFSSSPPPPSTVALHSSQPPGACEDPPAISAIKYAVDLARAAAAQAAYEAATAADEVASVGAGHGLRRGGQEYSGSVAERRRRRRSRRRRAVGLSGDDDDDDGEDRNVSGFFLAKDRSSRRERSRYLTPREEAEFSLCLKEEARLDSEVQRLRGCSSLDSVHSADYNRMKRRSDKAFLRARECRERITLSYKRLVVSIAAAYHGKGLSIQDLIQIEPLQEGCIGLLKGAQRFDHKKGYKLSTYVYWWIKQGITRAIAKKSRLIRLPGNLCESINKVADANSLLKGKLGRWPTYEEIADSINMDVSTVRIIAENSRPPTSIDQAGKDGLCLKDILYSADEIGPEKVVHRQLVLENLEKVLKTLSTREECILRLRYGLNGETARTCEEIGKLMKLSRERVRQIHHATLSSLREDESLVECLRIAVL